MAIFLFSTNAWYLAGISVAVVFAILIALVAVLNVFSMVAKSSGKTVKEQGPALAPGKPREKVLDDHLAVVATAIYLYLNSVQDEESGVITIKNNPNAGWHAVLNPRL